MAAPWEPPTSGGRELARSGGGRQGFGDAVKSGRCHVGHGGAPMPLSSPPSSGDGEPPSAWAWRRPRKARWPCDRLRNGGRQTVVVQHVSVADGGQAVVAGHVAPAGEVGVPGDR